MFRINLWWLASSLLIIAAAVFGSTSARAAADSPLTGSWEMRNAQGALRFTFRADGTGSINGVPLEWKYENDELAITMALVWRYENDKLAIKTRGSSVSYHAVVSGTDLMMSGGDLTQNVTLKRVEGEAKADTRITGKWQSPDGAVIEFKPDGTGANRRGTFKYTASEGVLLYNDGTSMLLFTYQIDGDKLNFNSDAGQVTFTRAAANASVAAAPAHPDQAAGVYVNRVKLTDDEIKKMEAQFHVRVIDGKYWYDAKCGAWGLDGGPCLGFLPAGLSVRGALPADASGKGTGVFINGRELHPTDIAALQKITNVVLPGRYWVDAAGNCGVEGNPTPLINLVQMANAQSRGGSYHSRSDITGIGSGGDGNTSYVMGKDWSVVIGD